MRDTVWLLTRQGRRIPARTDDLRRIDPVADTAVVNGEPVRLAAGEGRRLADLADPQQAGGQPARRRSSPPHPTPSR